MKVIQRHGLHFGIYLILALVAGSCSSSASPIADGQPGTTIDLPTPTVEAAVATAPPASSTATPPPAPTTTPTPDPTPAPIPDGCVAGADGDIVITSPWVDGVERRYEIVHTDLAANARESEPTVASLTVTGNGSAQRLTWTETGRRGDLITFLQGEQIVGDALFEDASISVEYGPLQGWVWHPPGVPLNHDAIMAEWGAMFDAVAEERNLDREQLFPRLAGQRFAAAGVSVLHKAPSILHALDGARFSTDAAQAGAPMRNPFPWGAPDLTGQSTFQIAENVDASGCAVLTVNTSLDPDTAVDEMVGVILGYVGRTPEQADMGNVIATASGMTLDQQITARYDTSTGFFRSIEARTTFVSPDLPLDRDFVVRITDVTPVDR